MQIAALVLLALPLFADLPDGAGKDATIKNCSKCHSPEQAVSLRQGQEEWKATLDKMIGMGAKIPDDSYDAILGYLVKYYGPEKPQSINVNTAEPIDFESLLSLPRSQANAIVQYRTDHGAFKTIDDFKKVPGIDFKRIESKKDRITF